MIRGKNREKMETHKCVLKMQLRKTRYTDLHVHVATSNLEKLEFSFWGKIEVYSYESKWGPLGQF